MGTGSGQYTASYDASGDMTCRAPNGSDTCSGTPTGQQLTYDNEGRLTQWQNTPSSPTSTDQYLYDGEGHRVEQQLTSGGTGGTGGTTTTTTVYVGSLESVATTSSTTTTTTYYSAAGQRIALAANGTLSYLASDLLGSASVAFNGSGTGLPTASQLYAPYGGMRYQNGAMPTDYGFTGQRNDATTGLDYYGARYYDPTIGQFTSADTVNDGLNRYSYVKGNPETATDPTGHRQCMDDTTCRIVTRSLGTVISAVGLNSALWARYLRNSAQDTPRTITINSTKLIHFDDHKLPGGGPRYIAYPTTTEVDNSPAILKALRDSERLGKLGLAMSAIGAVMDGVIAGHDYADAHPHAGAWKPVVYGVLHSVISTGITLGIGANAAPIGAEGIAGAAVITTVASPLIDDVADKGATFMVNGIQDTGDAIVKDASDYGTWASANIPLHIQVNFGPISFMTGTESSWP